ncbi:MAG TPA: hypothetical protein VHF26_07825 [Trebonia sp.]|nr:hypothetical protein [Trebonia sp.]
MARRKPRVAVPGVSELFRPPVPPLPATSDERQATGRQRHDQKITVYLSAAELLDLEHARLKLRRFGFVADRGRLVREAIAILLADLDARGRDSVIARRIRASQDRQDKQKEAERGLQDGPGIPGSPGIPEDTGISESTVPSLTWAQLLPAPCRAT